MASDISTFHPVPGIVETMKTFYRGARHEPAPWPTRRGLPGASPPMPEH